ncbi:MAG TPA: hypothetical protein VGH99_13055 [Pseudonocardia sp.]|jgi:hypothetical protein
MTDNPSSRSGEQVGATGAGAESGTAKRKRQFPWQVGLSVVAWLVLGVLLVVAGVGSNAGSGGGADESSVDQIQGSLGDSAVAGGQQEGHPTVLLLLGLAILLLSLMLLVGQGWARYVLAVLAIAAMVTFALGGSWQAIPVFALMVVGSVALLGPSAYRYLSGR